MPPFSSLSSGCRFVAARSLTQIACRVQRQQSIKPLRFLPAPRFCMQTAARCFVRRNGYSAARYREPTGRWTSGREPGSSRSDSLESRSGRRRMTLWPLCGRRPFAFTMPMTGSRQVSLNLPPAWPPTPCRTTADGARKSPLRCDLGPKRWLAAGPTVQGRGRVARRVSNHIPEQLVRLVLLQRNDFRIRKQGSESLQRPRGHRTLRPMCSAAS